jgi:hypothetical protein
LRHAIKCRFQRLFRGSSSWSQIKFLRIGIGGFGGSHEFFYGRIGKDGRIFIPKAVLFMARGKTENPADYFVDIMIEPA